MGSVQQLLRDQIPFQMVQVWRNSQEEIARFKKMENAVLFAAGSCWEGVDFPGDMVSSLIIVKLPFSVPDPIHEAQREQYRSLESYIQTIVVPDMQKKLRQGFGRAIRTEQDTCVVSILDHRASKKGRYRGDVLDALPKCQMAERIEEVEDLSEAGKWSVTTAENIRSVVASAQIRTADRTKSLVVFQGRFGANWWYW